MPKQPPDGRPQQAHGTPGPGKGPVAFRAVTACDCGCGRPARFEFRVGRDEVTIADPAGLRALIAEMAAGYRILFPDEPQPLEPKEATP